MMCPDENCVWNQSDRTGAAVCAFHECIVDKRNRVYKERLNLQHKPYLDIAERKKLKDLNDEWGKLIMCGDAVRA